MFHYYAPSAEPAGEDPTRAVALPGGLDSVKSLMACVGRALGFPPYFGGNFDAFWDCVRDLDPSRPGPAIVHRELPALPREKLATYLQLLRDASLYWERRGEARRLEVWFPAADAGRIESLLHDVPPLLDDG